MRHWDKWYNFVKTFPLFLSFPCHLLEVYISQISGQRIFPVGNTVC